MSSVGIFGRYPWEYSLGLSGFIDFICPLRGHAGCDQQIILFSDAHSGAEKIDLYASQDGKHGEDREMATMGPIFRYLEDDVEKLVDPD